MIHGVPQGELPLFVVGRSVSARTSDCFKFVALLYTTSVLLSATFFRSSEVSSIFLYFRRILSIGGMRGLYVIMNGMIFFLAIGEFFGWRRSSRSLVNAAWMALMTSCFG